MHDAQMIAVDMWREVAPRDVEGAETYADWAHERNYQRFRDHCETHLPGRVKILRMDTGTAADHVTDDSLDFVFIDADHTYEGCKRDIEKWAPKVRKGGMISGHDINWPSVHKAVAERFERFGGGPDNVWFTFKERT